MKRSNPAAKKSLKAVVMVAVVAALGFFLYSWWAARSLASGKKALSPILFTGGLIVAGFLALKVKAIHVLGAPLMVAGAALTGVEMVRRVVPMNGASRYRLGQNRPASVINRPAPVINRPASVVGSDGMRDAPGGYAGAWGGRGRF